MEYRFQVLDSLRGMASIGIVLYHLLRIYENPNINFFIQLGRIGTDVFFVLSGFLTAIAAASVINGRRSPITFLTQRVHKIYLVYIFSLITAAILIPTIIGLISYFKSSHLELNFVSLSFIEWIKIVSLTKVFDSTDWMLYKAFLPLNGVYWFIAILVQIYLFIFVCLLNKKYFYWIVSAVGFISIITMNPTVGDLVPYGLFLDRFHEFYFGMVSYWYYSRYNITNNITPKTLAIIIVFAIPIADLMIVNEDYLRFLWSLLLAILIPCLLKISPPYQSNSVLKLLIAIGTFSFSIYLLHAPLFPLVDMLARNVTGLSSKLYLPFLAFPLIIVFCYIWSIFFEKPGSLSGTLKALKHPIKAIFQIKEGSSSKPEC